MSRRLYFIFSNTTSPWLARILKPGYQHVSMLAELENACLMHVDPRRGRVEHEYSNEFPLHVVLERAKSQGCNVVYYDGLVAGRHDRTKRGPMITCATYLAYTAGIDFHGVTPYQFFKTLIKRGGELI